MTLENQVCSLELAKRLKELGVKQESLFYWHIDSMNEFQPRVRMGLPSGDIATYGVSAFTVAELGEMLPQLIEKDEKEYWLRISKEWNISKGKDWFIYYSTEIKYEDNSTLNFEIEPTEADARAKMLIYLLEDKLITL